MCMWYIVEKKGHPHYQILATLSNLPLCCAITVYLYSFNGHLRGLTGSVLDHRSLPPEFEPRCGHIWMVFHLWPFIITFGGHAAHLAHHMHKSGRKTSIITCTFLIEMFCDSTVFYLVQYSCVYVWEISGITVITRIHLIVIMFLNADTKIVTHYYYCYCSRFFRIGVMVQGGAGSLHHTCT